jgi:hypothetical protein
LSLFVLVYEGADGGEPQAPVRVLNGLVFTVGSDLARVFVVSSRVFGNTKHTHGLEDAVHDDQCTIRRLRGAQA